MHFVLTTNKKKYDSNLIRIKHCIKFVIYVLTSVSCRRLLRLALRYLSPHCTDNPTPQHKDSTGAELMQCRRHH
jgi:hypothetical protein